MDFYFTNRQFELQEIVSTNTSTAIVMAGEEDKLSIENGSRTLTGTLYFTNKQSTQVKVAAAIGNYILYHDKNNKDVWMTIVEIEHNPLNGTHTFVAEDAGLDLLNELVGPYKADKAYNIAYYINKFTFDSDFELGFNEIPKLTRKLEWESEDSTALARVLSVATQFDNAEIEFSFSVENTTVLKKYINIYKKRGKDNRQTLYVNIDVNNIVVKSDIYELATAIYAQGGTPDGKNSSINLKGYKWTDTDGRYLLGSDGILRDKENGAKWSRLLPGQANPNGAYILRRKSYETTNQKTLLDSALRELKTVSEPAINYEVDIAELPEGVSVGDTIYLVDEDEEVYLSARVLELSYIYSTSSYTATLGDYLIKQGGVSQSLIDLANDLKDQANRKKYDVKLEATAQAFIDKKGTITIVAKVFDGTLDVSPNFSEYKWSRIDSEGVTDPEWSNITNTVTISADDEPLWTYICEVSNSLEDGEKYLIGSDRITVTSLVNGEPGPPGNDGKPTYLHTAYANDLNGADFSTTDSVNRSYIGTYSDNLELGSSDYRKYVWVKIKGEPGVGVKTTEITYQGSPSGTLTPTGAWSKTIPELNPGYFLWTKTVITYTNDTYSTSYNVSKMGDTGAPTGVIESDRIPIERYDGMLWKCTGVISGYQQNAIYRWNGSLWELFFFSAANIQAKTLSAITADLGEVKAGIIDGSLIRGSEFLNSYQYTESDGAVRTGSLDINLGQLLNQYKSTNGLEGFFKIDRDGDISSAKNSNGKQSQYRLSPDTLTMTGLGYLGSITSKYASQINSVGNKLWSGEWFVSASQTVTPSIKMSDCLNGWVLEWRGYTNGASINGDYNYTYIPKIHGTAHSGAVMSVWVVGYNGASFRKIIYVTDSNLKGHSNNASSPANNSVLTAVYAF